MKVDLEISVTSNVAAASGCPKVVQWDCGIAYRMP